MNSDFHNNGGKVWIPLSEAANGGPYRPDYLRLLVNQGKIPGRKINDIWHITKEALHEYTSKQEKSRAIIRKKNAEIVRPTRQIENWGYFLNFEEEEEKIVPVRQINFLPVAQVLAIIIALTVGFGIMEKTSPIAAKALEEKIVNLSQTPQKLFASLPFESVRHSVSNTQLAAVSFFDSFRSLKDLALKKFFFATTQTTQTKQVNPKVLPDFAEASSGKQGPTLSTDSQGRTLRPETQSAITATIPVLNLNSLKSDLRTELQSYINARLTTYDLRPTTINTPSGAAGAAREVGALRQEILLADTRPSVTRQSSSDTSHLSSALTSSLNSLTDGGTFTNSTLTNATISGPTGGFTNLTFGYATGTSATTTNFFSTTASSTNLFSQSATLGALTVSGNSTLSGNLTVGGNTTTIGQLLSTRIPTLTHVFSSWPTGTSNASDATIYINPASAAADTNIFAAAVAGSVKFLVDAEGDIYGNNLVLSGSTSQGVTTIAGNLTVQDNTTLGDASTDQVSVSGKLGVGTTTPWGKFSVSGSPGGTVPLFTVSSSTSAFATTTVFHIDSNGNVGIGTASPNYKLEVNGTASTTNFFATYATSTNATSTNFFSTTASSTNLFFTTGTGGTFTVSGTGTFNNILANASSTLQAFTFTNATGTNATTTNFFSTTASSTNLFSTSGTFGNLSVAGSLTLRGITYTLPSADGTSGQVLTTNGAGVLSWATKTEGISQDFKGLSLRTSPNADVAATTVVLDHADEIVMDTGNRVATWDDLSAVISSSGAGGLDTGSEAASTWYEIYAIRKSSDGTKNLLLHRAKDYFLDESHTTQDVDQRTGNVDSNKKIAQSFKVDTAGYLEFVDVNLKKFSSPTDVYYYTIEADSGGVPSGTPLATSDKISASLVSTSYQYIRLPFRSPTSLSAATTYWLVFQRSGALDATNHLSWGLDSAAGYANGKAFRYTESSTSWAEIVGYDSNFKIYITRNNTAVTMPSGYDQKAQVGWVVNDGSSNFAPFTALDHRVTFLDAAGGQVVTATVMTLFDFSPSNMGPMSLPPGPVSVNMRVVNSTAAQNNNVGPVPNGYAFTNSAPDPDNGVVWSYNDTAGQIGSDFSPVNTEYQGLYLRVSGGTGTFYGGGYTWGSGGGADVAEEYLVEDQSIAPGDVVSIAQQGSLYIERAEASSTQPVFGIVSTKPGLRLSDFDRPTNNNRAVALNGRVPVRISEENGPINVGDRLTLSKTKPGTAMKQTLPGQSIGMALEASAGKDKVMTFVNLSYWIPTQQLALNTGTTTASSTATTTDETASSTVEKVTSLVLDNLMSYIVTVFKNVFEIVFEKGLIKVAELVTDKFTTKELCVGNTCVTEEQFMQMVAASASVSQNEQTTINNEQSTTETGGGSSQEGATQFGELEVVGETPPDLPLAGEEETTAPSTSSGQATTTEATAQMAGNEPLTLEPAPEPPPAETTP